MKAVAFFALVGAVLAAPLEERDVDPLSASLAILGVLPSSLYSLALTNATAAAAEISSEFATGTPTWFTQLPTDVQSYFITAGEAGDAVPTGVSSNSTVLYSNGTTSTSGSSGSSTITAAATTAAASIASSASTGSSSSSSAGAALPVQVFAGGLAGVAGLVGLLAL